MSDLNDKLRNKAFEQWHKLRRHLDRMDARLAWEAGYVAGRRATPAPQAAPSGLTFDEAWKRIDWCEWHLKPIAELVRFLHTLTNADPAKESATSGEVQHQVELDAAQGTWMNVEAKDVLVWQRKGFNVQTLYTAPSAASSDARDAALEILLTRIDDAFTNYERMGAVCEFEGQPMIYAATLEEIVQARGEYHVALSAPSAGEGES